MSDVADRLTAAALRPLAGNAELRQAGIVLLEPLVQDSPAAAEAMIARWNALDARQRGPRWRWLLTGVLVVVSAWVWVGVMREPLRYRRLFAGIANDDSGVSVGIRDELGRWLSAKDRLLVFGDLTQASQQQRMLALWNSDPNNPTYFAEYARAYRNGRNHGTYPADFLATARRLDPGNSWFVYQAAGALAAGTVEAVPLTYQAKKAGHGPSWKILDEARLNQAMALLHDARKLDRHVDRRQELIALRTPLLPRFDEATRAATQVYALNYNGSNGLMKRLASAIAARAWLAGEAGDRATLKLLIDDTDAFLTALRTTKAPTLLDSLIYTDCVRTTNSHLQAAAEKLAMKEEAQRLGSINAKLAEWRRKWPANEWRQDCELGRRASVLANLLVSGPAYGQYREPLLDAEMKPGRMVNHLWVSRVCLLAAWVILGGASLALTLFCWSGPPVVLHLAERMKSLLLPADWGWILAPGVALPYVYVSVLTRFTPLGGADWSLFATGRLLPLTDYLAMVLLLLVTPGLIANWRLRRRMAALGPGGGHPVAGWIAVTAGLLCVPVMAMMLPATLTQMDCFDLGLIVFPDLKQPMAWALPMLAPLVLWVGFVVWRSLTSQASRQVAYRAVAQALISAYAFGMLLIMVSMPLYTAAQARWERHDPLLELTASGEIRYDGEVAKQLMKEVGEILELDTGR